MDGADVPNPEDIDEALSGAEPSEPPMDQGGGSAEGVDPHDPAPDQDSAQGVIDEVLEIATRSPQKSLKEIDDSEYFDPENGGSRRLMLVFDDAISQGEGLQNWMHVLVALVEIGVSGDLDVLPQGSEGEESQDHDSDTVLEQTEATDLEIA